MWNLNSRVAVTPAGRAAVEAIKHRTSRRPMLLCGICDAPIREAFDNKSVEEYCICDECEGQEVCPSVEPCPLPNPRFCPSTCAQCGIGNIYGPPSCTDSQCPSRCQ